MTRPAAADLAAAALRLHAARMNLGERETAGGRRRSCRPTPPFPSSRYLRCQRMCMTSPGYVASGDASVTP